MGKESLQSLREKLDSLQGGRIREYYTCSLFKPGIPKSAIIELLGPAKVKFVGIFLKEHPEIEVLWLRDRSLIFPPALSQLGADITRITFVHTDQFQFESIRLAARSKTTPMMIAPAVFDEAKLKKLKFLVEESQSSLFLISYTPTSGYAITAQLEVSYAPENGSQLKVVALKYKCEGLACE